MKTTVAWVLAGKWLAGVWLAASCLAFAPGARGAEESEPPAPATQDQAGGGEKHLLRYKFKAGETLRWEVEHQAQIRTTISGTTQTAETLSKSIKVWEVDSVDQEGRARFVHSVQSVDMRHKLTGRREVRYNSETDAEAPDGFEEVAKAVGVGLATITLDPRGKIIERQQQLATNAPTSAMITIPLPEEAVSVGEEWQVASDAQVSLKEGGYKTIKTRQRFRLINVRDGVATIQVDTQILSPIRDPNIEAQLMQTESNGTVRFDIAAGRVVSQQTDVDKRVHGAPNEASSMHCLTRFTEKLLPDGARTSRKAGPAAAPASAEQPSVRKASRGVKSTNPLR